MGKIKQGILGGFNGTVGTVVGGSWKGMAYMRGKAQSIKNPRTEKQMSQRIKFGMAQKFVKVMTAYLKVGFRNYTQHQTATNAAMSHTVRNCMAGKYPAFGIDPSKVLVSSGSLMPGRFCTVKVASNVATFPGRTTLTRATPASTISPCLSSTISQRARQYSPPKMRVV